MNRKEIGWNGIDTEWTELKRNCLVWDWNEMNWIQGNWLESDGNTMNWIKGELIGMGWESNEMNKQGEVEDLGHFLRKQGMIRKLNWL